MSFKINEFRILDWRSNIKLNDLIFFFFNFLLTTNKCHHLKPKYSIPRSKVSILQLKSFSVDIK